MGSEKEGGMAAAAGTSRNIHVQLQAPQPDSVPSVILRRSQRRKKSEDSATELTWKSTRSRRFRIHEPASAAAGTRTRTTVVNVTVDDVDALECGVCFLVLRPPIFQCELGHVVCSACRDKLEATGNGSCHVCGVAVATRGGYRRCHAMEQLVDCIRVPCPYAAYGCDATPPYHGQESHRQVCRHAPCHCPGESCGFVGSIAALLNHFACAHDWPCTTSVRDAATSFSIRLRVGLNFFVLLDHAGDDGDQAAAATGSVPFLFLLNVTQERLGRAISVLCIRPHAAATAPTIANSVDRPVSTQQCLCVLVFTRYAGRLCSGYSQWSEFNVVCTDLSNGLPSPDDCFQFIVPNAVLGDGDNDYIEVKVSIIIS